MNLTSEQSQKLLEGREFEIAPKHRGWTSRVIFRRWTRYGKDRLYYSFSHRDGRGRPRDHYDGKGYIDLETGEVKAPPSDCQMVKGLVDSEERLSND